MGGLTILRINQNNEKITHLFKRNCRSMLNGVYRPRAVYFIGKGHTAEWRYFNQF